MTNLPVFWMSKQPMLPNKDYILKLATKKVAVRLKKIETVVDASDLSNSGKEQIERHDIAKCILECLSPIAFDISSDIQNTGRFVIVDRYDIVGGGIITEYIQDAQAKARAQVFRREEKWDRSTVTLEERALRYGQDPKLILITGRSGIDKKGIAKMLEKRLFEAGRKIYFLGIGNLLRGLDADIDKDRREEHIRRLGEVSHILMDSGQLVVATASDLSKEEIDLLSTITSERIVIICIGEQSTRDEADLYLDSDKAVEHNAAKVINLLKFKNIIFSI
jgi:bifunctional enzyme CysN/CysC